MIAPTVRIATWNLAWQFLDWESRQDAIAWTLQELDADVVLLQESWPEQIERLATELGFHYCGGYRSGDAPKLDTDRHFGNGILSRWELSDAATVALPEHEGFGHRTLVGATSHAPFGPVPIYTAHVAHRYDASALRQKQFHAICECIESRHPEAASSRSGFPPVLAGDLNAVPDSREIQKLTGRDDPYIAGRVWSDVWEQVGGGPGVTWSASNPLLDRPAWPNRRLDYVLVRWPRRRPAGNPVSASIFGSTPVDGVMASDHFGVVAELQTGSPDA